MRPYVASKANVYSWPSAHNTTGTSTSKYMLDVKSAFLHSKIDEEVFVKQDPGYGILEAATGIPMVMKLKQAVYGLRTASRVWHLALDKALKTIGFTSTKNDPCLHIYEMGGGMIY